MSQQNMSRTKTLKMTDTSIRQAVTNNQLAESNPRFIQDSLNTYSAQISIWIYSDAPYKLQTLPTQPRGGHPSHSNLVRGKLTSPTPNPAGDGTSGLTSYPRRRKNNGNQVEWWSIPAHRSILWTKAPSGNYTKGRYHKPLSSEFSPADDRHLYLCWELLRPKYSLTPTTHGRPSISVSKVL